MGMMINPMSNNELQKNFIRFNSKTEPTVQNPQAEPKAAENTREIDESVRVAEAGLAFAGESLRQIDELVLQARDIDAVEYRSALQDQATEILDGLSQALSEAGQPVKDALQTLGIENFDVSSPFARDTIASAVDMIAAHRSQLASMANTFSHTINSNDITSLNLSAPRTPAFENDTRQSIPETTKEQTLDKYRVAMYIGGYNSGNYTPVK